MSDNEEMQDEPVDFDEPDEPMEEQVACAQPLLPPSLTFGLGPGGS